MNENKAPHVIAPEKKTPIGESPLVGACPPASVCALRGLIAGMRACAKAGGDGERGVGGLRGRESRLECRACISGSGLEERERGQRETRGGPQMEPCGPGGWQEGSRKARSSISDDSRAPRASRTSATSPPLTLGLDTQLPGLIDARHTKTRKSLTPLTVSLESLPRSCRGTFRLDDLIVGLIRVCVQFEFNVVAAFSRLLLRVGIVLDGKKKKKKDGEKNLFLLL